MSLIISFNYNFNLIYTMQGFLPYVTLILFNLSTYLRLKAMQVSVNSYLLVNIVSYLLYQKEEARGLTIAASHLREKEIKLSQIGLIIVAGRQMKWREYLSKFPFSSCQCSSSATVSSGFLIFMNCSSLARRQQSLTGQSGYVRRTPQTSHISHSIFCRVYKQHL